MRAEVRTIVLALTLLPVPWRAEAAPALIILGGAWGPEGNQASIETQVQALLTAFSTRTTRVLFAAGDDETRSVQARSDATDRASELFGLIFDRTDDLRVAYRPTSILGARRASRDGFLSSLQAAILKRTGVVVLAAGHGAPADDRHPASLELWGPDDRLFVDELAEFLDGAHSEQPVAFVLGHCHSGAFTRLVHRGGDEKRPVAKPARCVLAAVPEDREAAGCTPDVDDPSARAYISWIAEAFANKRGADFDGNQAVSLDEAHAFAKIHDPTVDLPVSSSELWLQSHPKAKTQSARGWTVSRILKKTTRPADAAVLRALAPPDPNATVDKIASDIEADSRRIERGHEELDELSRHREILRRRILDRVLSKWPELANPYHPVARRLLGARAEEVVAKIEGDGDLRELQALDQTMLARGDEILAEERRLVRLERWWNTASRVMREETFRRRARPSDIDTLNALMTCEGTEP